MEYRYIGQSSLQLPVITFGAWAAGGWMWGGNDRRDAIEAIKASYELGVTAIDTAPIYGQGESEEIVGEAIQGLPRDKVQICTKYGLRWDLNKGNFYFSSTNNQGQAIDIYKNASRDSIIYECEQSLQRLQTDYIDLYQIHWPDVSTPVQETMEAVSRLIEQGKIRYAGVCNYNLEQMMEASQCIELVSNQVKYSMVSRDIENELVPWLIKNNCSVLAYSPMERGLLTGRILPGHAFAEGDHRANMPVFNDENLRRTHTFLNQIRPIALEKNISLSQLVLRYTIQQPGITIALAGARNAKQAVENAKAADIKLSSEEILQINQALKTLQLAK